MRTAGVVPDSPEIDRSKTAALTRGLLAFEAADLDDRVVAASKRLILDTVGCAVGGTEMPSSRIISDYVVRSGGAKEATVLPLGRRVPVAAAAYANSHAGNALDADDTFRYSVHAGAATVLSALAVAEWQQSSGADFIAAVTAGYEFAARVAASMSLWSVTDDHRVVMAPVRGYSFVAFGSAMAAARLLGLDPDVTLHAIGLTAATTPLPVAGHWSHGGPPRPMQKYAMNGSYGHAGVTAALLARDGFTGDTAVLDGPGGFWQMSGSLGFDPMALTEDLGQRWAVEEVAYKPYPCCRFSHPALDMYTQVTRDEDLTMEDIEAIRVYVHDGALGLQMDRPEVPGSIDSQFSIPHLLAVVAAGIPRGPRWHSAQTRTDPEIQAFARRVTVSREPLAARAVRDQILAQGYLERLPSRLEIEARGSTFRASAERAFGDPWWDETRLSDRDLRDKFRDVTVDVLTVPQYEGFLEVVDGLEREPNVARLVRCLAPERRSSPPAVPFPKPRSQTMTDTAAERGAVIRTDRDGVVTLTLDRPAARNALRQEDFTALGRAIRALDEEEGVRALVIAGNGPAFCAGGDLRSPSGVIPLTTGPPDDFLRFYRYNIREAILAVREARVPTIAMVNGAAYGAGFDLALACDMRVGSTAARFCVAWLRHGAVPAGGTTWLLPPIVGLGRAAEWIMTGREIQAEEAERTGLLNRLVTPEELADATYDLAARVASMSPVAVQLSKVSLHQTGATPRTAMDLLAAQQVTCMHSPGFTAREWARPTLPATTR
jgi:2-methylcitrate dehydratase PrpD/enoyl-CoA hydratase/carnithine racemase